MDPNRRAVIVLTLQRAFDLPMDIIRDIVRRVGAAEEVASQITRVIRGFLVRLKVRESLDSFPGVIHNRRRFPGLFGRMEMFWPLYTYRQERLIKAKDNYELWSRAERARSLGWG